MGQKRGSTPKQINEITRFDNPDETHGWTGDGGILPDDPAGAGPVNRWFSTGVKKEFGSPFPGQTRVRVVIRLRAILPGETLRCTGPGGISHEQHNIEPVKPALYEFFLTSTPKGEFCAQFNLASRHEMAIQTIEVVGPSNLSPTQSA